MERCAGEAMTQAIQTSQARQAERSEPRRIQRAGPYPARRTSLRAEKKGEPRWLALNRLKLCDGSRRAAPTPEEH